MFIYNVYTYKDMYYLDMYMWMYTRSGHLFVISNILMDGAEGGWQFSDVLVNELLQLDKIWGYLLRKK